MPKQDLNKLLSQSAARSMPGEIRRGKGVGLSIEDQEPQVMWVDIEAILDNPYQHAEEIDADEYAALIESIKVDGFQGALNVSPIEGREGFYFITSGGHQRRNAARDAGLKKLPVFVGASPAEKKQLGLRLARENTAQVNRSPVNLGFLYIQLIEEFGMTQEEIANEIKKDRYHVNFALMAARSAADIRAALREKYSPRVMTYLRRLDDVQQRAPIIAGYLSGDLTVEGVRVAVEQVQRENKKREDELLERDTNEEQRAAQNEPVASSMQAVSSDDGERQVEQEEQKASVLQRVKEANASSPLVTHPSTFTTNHDTSERTSKIQAVFSRVETYRRHIEKRRADGETVHLSDREAMLLGKIIDRCHTLLDTYGEKLKE